ncbi:MAG: GNAT family N-acetyltransferase [Bacteroidaceae bacterium]
MVAPSLHTPRLLLRPWEESDARDLYLLARDPDVGPRAGWSPHQSVEESRSVIRNVFSNSTTWAVVLQESNTLVGAIGYGHSCDCALPCRPGEPIVGYWIGKPYWNRGFCSEALKAVIQYVRMRTSLSSLLSGHFVDNPASGSVMLKCGFIPTGEICQDNSLHDGAHRDIRVLRLELRGETLLDGE